LACACKDQSRKGRRRIFYQGGRRMAKAFKLLTMAAFQKLALNEKLRYIEAVTSNFKPGELPSLFKPKARLRVAPVK
jgi:hypothetical protein